MFGFQICKITSTKFQSYLLMSNVWWFAVNLGPLIKIIIKEQLELVVEGLCECRLM